MSIYILRSVFLLNLIPQSAVQINVENIIIIIIIYLWISLRSIFFFWGGKGKRKEKKKRKKNFFNELVNWMINNFNDFYWFRSVDIDRCLTWQWNRKIKRFPSFSSHVSNQNYELRWQRILKRKGTRRILYWIIWREIRANAN